MGTAQPWRIVRGPEPSTVGTGGTAVSDGVTVKVAVTAKVKTWVGEDVEVEVAVRDGVVVLVEL